MSDNDQSREQVTREVIYELYTEAEKQLKAVQVAISPIWMGDLKASADWPSAEAALSELQQTLHQLSQLARNEIFKN